MSDDLTDPRPGPYLDDVLGGKDARDVLADRIETWAETKDWHVYDYVDRLLTDLDAAGFDVRKRRPDALLDGPGATLLVGINMPDENQANDPDAAADSLVATINRARKLTGEAQYMVNLWPDPQWFDARTLEVLKRANELQSVDPTEDAAPHSQHGDTQ